jgi:hypothetical protein
MYERTLEIGYDLSRPGQNYPGLIDYIKSFGAWANPLKSTWLVRTSLTPSELAQKLRTHTDTNDKIMVLDVTGDNWATYGMDPKVTEWMRTWV